MEAGVKAVRSNWTGALLICRKCSKKLDGGFGPKGKTSLAKALRQELDVRKGRKEALGIVEVQCLKVCPKGAVTVVSGARPGDWLLVPRGAAMGEIATALLGAQPPVSVVTPAKV